MQNSALVQSIQINAVQPSLQDNTADIDRLKKAVSQACQENTSLDSKNLCVPYAAMGLVAKQFRSSKFQGYALINCLASSLELIDFSAEPYSIIPGIALDLGTTHLEATLVNLVDGKQLAHGHAINKQIKYGADILSRIHYASQKKNSTTQAKDSSEGINDLQNAVLQSINELIAKLAHKTSVHPNKIRGISISGNTTMVHLLLGVSPYHLCREPYIPLVNAPDPMKAKELGLDIHPLAPVVILPSIGSYFGGDLISGILASNLDTRSGTSMLIDVGTNAEVVLGNSEWLIACAGAAGPALEGGIAKMGMRAGPGAVEHVQIDTKKWTLQYQTIENGAPAGICGSGMIDLVAELFLARIIDIRGKFRSSVQGLLPEQQKFLQKHLTTKNDHISFIVSPAEESANKQAVTLSQIDLDAMMRSKAAMHAILSTITTQVGIEFPDLEKIFVAGAFGKHIDPKQAITLGMLPDLPLDTYESVGNSSLKGAEMVLLREEARRRSIEIGNKITYVELNVNQDFMIRFSGSRFIPHTDPKLFPSVPVFLEN